MPPQNNSRHIFAQGRYDTDGNVYLSDRGTFPYREIGDTARHVVQLGDTLWSLAARYYGSSRLYWIIADFQPTPIVDPTLKLREGATILIPSRRAVNEFVFDLGRSRIDDA